MRPRRLVAGMLPALLVLWACDEGSGPSSRDGCPELGEAAFPGRDSLDEPAYKVVFPNGGETFKVGETMTVTVAGGGSAGSSIVEIWRLSRAGNRFARLPGSPATSFDPRSICEFTFTIPESLAAGSGGSFSLVSDSLRIRVAHYSSGADHFDYSDSLFRIVE